MAPRSGLLLSAEMDGHAVKDPAHKGVLSQASRPEGPAVITTTRPGRRAEPWTDTTRGCLEPRAVERACQIQLGTRMMIDCLMHASRRSVQEATRK